MITAVDSNILIDILRADTDFGSASATALRHCRRDGRILVGEIVWAEVVGAVGETGRLTKLLDGLGLEYVPTTRPAADHAGRLWRRYRNAGGQRTRMVPDFLVGAHAVASADRLLTRDRGFYRAYFRGLKIVDPSRPPR
ncbi:MAG: type II toxin-antitoxin system VapC family toxin [Deltaproteobacteria bacterium]